MYEGFMEELLSSLVSVKKVDIKKAAETLALSFMDDPLSNSVFQKEATRFQNLLAYFHFRIKYGLKYGEIYSTSYDFEGVAIWLPGKKTHVTNWRGMLSGGMKLYNEIGSDLMTKFNKINQYTTSFRNSIMQPPYYQLSPIGVIPEMQGKGFGSKLLKPMFKRFDAKQIICFLETQTKANIPLYQKYGFKVLKEGKFPNTNLQHWGMKREPK